MGRFVSNLFGGKIMEFSKLFCSKYFYIELYRIGLDYRTGFRIEFDIPVFRFRVSVIGVTLLIIIGSDAYSS